MQRRVTSGHETGTRLLTCHPVHLLFREPPRGRIVPLRRLDRRGHHQVHQQRLRLCRQLWYEPLQLETICSREFILTETLQPTTAGSSRTALHRPLLPLPLPQRGRPTPRELAQQARGPPPARQRHPTRRPRTPAGRKARGPPPRPRRAPSTPPPAPTTPRAPRVKSGPLPSPNPSPSSRTRSPTPGDSGPPSTLPTSLRPTPASGP